MVVHSETKLHRLQQLPDGMLVDAAWLERRGYSRSLRSHYVKTGWLNQPAPRVYRRSRGRLDWKHVVISLQAFMNSSLTVGGRTALEEQGYAHYLGSGPAEVHLYGPKAPPAWLAALSLDVTFKWHNSRHLFPDDPTIGPVDPGTPPDEEVPMLPGGFMASAAGVTWPIRYSSPERAILELLDELPSHETFHQVDMLMEGLANLSPTRLQTVLETCKSVKVKRLFFLFADRHHHAWLSRLDRAAVDLGTGKRSLVKGGRLDPRYNITVPRDFDAVP